MKTTAIVLAALTLAAWDAPSAQTPAPWAASASGAKSSAAARSNAIATSAPVQNTAVRASGGAARASQNQKVVVVAPQAGAASTTPQSQGNVGYPATSNQQVWSGPQAASAIAPSILNYNPCAGEGGSGAVQAPMFGLSIGGNTMDRGCQIMNTRVPYASEWAAATLCRSSSDVRRAAMDIGHPCPQDRQQETYAATPVSAPVPTQPVGSNGYCYVMSRNEAARHPECK